MPTAEDGDFQLFMSLYPRKTGRPTARTMWRLYVKHEEVRGHAKVSGRRPDPQRVLAGLSRWISYWDKHPELIAPHASTWIMERRWAKRPPNNRGRS